MLPLNARSLVIAAWVVLVLGTFWASGASSGFSWMLLVVAIVGPPLVMLALWSEGPPQTIAEVLYDAERKR